MSNRHDQLPAHVVRRSKLQFLLVAFVFGAPLILATFMYSSGRWQPTGSTNHGFILEPIINLVDELPAETLETQSMWLLIYANDEECDETCRKALLRLRQSRLMLGNEMNRVERLFLHGAKPLDTVFLAEYHAGLKTLTDNGLLELLASKRPQQAAGGGIFLVDPLGNLILYFSPDIEPGDMVDDIKHLLELSRIG